MSRRKAFKFEVQMLDSTNTGSSAYLFWIQRLLEKFEEPINREESHVRNEKLRANQQIHPNAGIAEHTERTCGMKSQQ